MEKSFFARPKKCIKCIEHSRAAYGKIPSLSTGILEYN
jgi:hypothetical protein